MPSPDSSSHHSDTATMLHRSPNHSPSGNDGSHLCAAMPPSTPIPPSHPPATDATLKPWLGLRARLVLSPISLTLVSLIFVATRMLISAADVDDKVASLKNHILATCRGAEGAASTLASLPTVMAHNANQATVKAVQATVQGTGRVMMLAITAIEEVLKWLVDSYRSLFVCFIELLVRGSLAVLIAAVALISDAVHEAAEGIRSAIQASVEGINTLLSSTISGINAIIGAFGQHVDAPTVSIPSLDALSNITLPTTIQDSLLSINSSLPTLDNIRQKMDTLIVTPFEAIKTEINTTIGAFRFDHTVLPVPPLNTVTFCERVDVSPLDDLAHDLKRLAYVGAGFIALLVVALALLCAATEWWSWRSMRKHVEYTREAWESANLHADSSAPATSPWRRGAVVEEKEAFRSTPTTAPTISNERILDLLELSKHPLLALVAFKVGRVLGVKSPALRARLRWWMSWISHPAAVAALLAGLVGLASVELQILAVRSVQHVYEGKLTNAFDGISDGISTSINAKLHVASSDFANKSNVVIAEAEAALNDHLFAWVNVTTTTMNSTLNEFMDDITDVLNSVFGSTPLNAPLQTFIQCFIGRKVEGIQTALTWMHDNAHVTFTLVDDDVLSLGNETLRQLSDPIKASLMGQQQGDDGGEDGGVVGGLVGVYLRHLEKERTMFYVLLAIYALVLVVGTLIVFWNQIRDRAATWRLSRKPWIRAPITPFRALSLRRSKVSGGGGPDEPGTPTRAYANAAPRCGPTGPRLNFTAISYPIVGGRSRGEARLAPASAACEERGVSEQPVPTPDDHRSSNTSSPSTPDHDADADAEPSWLSYLKRAVSLSSSSVATHHDRAPPSASSDTTTLRSVYSQSTGVTGHTAQTGTHRRRTSRLVCTDHQNDSRTSLVASAISSSSPLRQRFSPSPSQHTFGHRTSVGAGSCVVRPGTTEGDVAQEAAEGEGVATVTRDDSTSSRRRQLRFTATPTHAVEARKRIPPHTTEGAFLNVPVPALQPTLPAHFLGQPPRPLPRPPSVSDLPKQHVRKSTISQPHAVDRPPCHEGQGTVLRRVLHISPSVQPTRKKGLRPVISRPLPHPLSNPLFVPARQRSGSDRDMAGVGGGTVVLSRGGVESDGQGGADGGKVVLVLDMETSTGVAM